MRSPSNAIDAASVQAVGAARRWAAIFLLMILCRRSVARRVGQPQAGDGRDIRRRLHDARVAFTERPAAIVATIAALTMIVIVFWLLLHPERIPI
jgi:hypothetical protein